MNPERRTASGEAETPRQAAALPEPSVTRTEAPIGLAEAAASEQPAAAPVPVATPAQPRAPAPGRPFEREVRPAPVLGPARALADGDDAAIDRGATAPQLRRFIKSRAYVPMHELRRRFAIIGDDDEVTPVDLERRRVFVGLPEREGRLLGELLRGGDIGFELSLDPISPIVVGVYPMRPVTRG